jgi:hypothetical protein
MEAGDERQTFVLYTPSQAAGLSDQEAVEVKRKLEQQLAEKLGISAEGDPTGTETVHKQSWGTNSAHGTETALADGVTADVHADFGHDDDNDIEVPDIHNDDQA